MSIFLPERRGKKGGKKHADMHKCINPKHLEAPVNMINGLRGEERRRPARRVLHGGSRLHRVDRLHTLHGDSITSCSLDVGAENAGLKHRLCEFTPAALLDATGTSGRNCFPSDYLFKNIPFAPLSKHIAGSSFEENRSRDHHTLQSVNGEKNVMFHYTFVIYL